MVYTIGNAKDEIKLDGQQNYIEALGEGTVCTTFDEDQGFCQTAL